MQIVPGQAWQRWGTLAFAVASGVAYALWARGSVPGFVLAGACALFVLFGIHASAVVYEKWMHFAESLSVWVVRGLFTVIYVLVVPIVWLLRWAAIRGSGSGKQDGTHWVRKAKGNQTREDMESMG